jgi:hypothetical protein
MINHGNTSRDHPKADGLAEPMVQTVKREASEVQLEEGTSW